MSIKVVGSNLVHQIPAKKTESGGGESSITVDSELSLSSENPVQNKVITKALNDVGDNIENTITDWLEENITQETGYVLDDTLTVSGAAADAKATGDALSALKSDIGQWYFTKSVSGSRYPYIQINEFGSRVYFKLIEPLGGTFVYVNGSNDNWQTQTQLYTQSVALEGYSYYVDVPAGYTSLKFATSMPSEYTGTMSAIIHTVDDHTISQNVINLSERMDDLETDVAESLSAIGDKLTGTNFNKFYLNTAPFRGISTINNDVFNLKQYSVETGKVYYLSGKSVSLNAELPVAAFGTEEVVAGNSYIEKLLDGSTVGTDYFVSYIPPSDGYIYVAWVTGKAELEVYSSIPVVDVVNTLITESEKKAVKIQLFGDSITDNQWGDNTTWANYIQQMMPDYIVTVVNDAVGGCGIGHGKSTTTDSHQSDEYNYVWDLVTNGTTLQTDADAVVILVGTNNWASSTALGDMSSTGYGTIYGALKGILEYISTHSAATVFVCTVPQRYNSVDKSKPSNANGEPLDSNGVSLAEFCVPFEKVSAFYGMPCVRLNSALGWNRLNISNFTGDGLHPNAKGDLMLAKFICSELMKHI